MKSAIIILLFALVLWLYFFLRFIIRRMCLLISLRKFTKKYDYQLKRNLWNCLLPLNGSSSSSVVIETNRSIYDIKLFGFFLKNREVHFRSTKEYSTRWIMPREHRSESINEICANPLKSLGSFDDAVYMVSSVQKERIPVLLHSPDSFAFLRCTHLLSNRIVRLYIGEKIAGSDLLFADSDFLFRYISKREHKDF